MYCIVVYVACQSYLHSHILRMFSIPKGALSYIRPLNRKVYVNAISHVFGLIGSTSSACGIPKGTSQILLIELVDRLLIKPVVEEVIRKRLSYTSLVKRKRVFGVSDQVRHKPGGTAKEDGWRLESSKLATRGINLSRKRTTKILFRLRG